VNNKCINKINGFENYYPKTDNVPFLSVNLLKTRKRDHFRFMG